MRTSEQGRGILCMVTDRTRLAAGSESAMSDAVVAQVGEAARSGVDLVQVREGSLPPAALAELVGRCLQVARGSRTRVVVNDRLDVALAVAADGVHLRGDSLDPARVRSLVPAGFLVGRSVHDRQEALDMEAASSIDYLMFGTVFPTASKPPDHVCAGADELDRVARAVRIPVLGIGGISARTLPAVVGTGAAGFAAIDFFAGRDPDVEMPRSVSAAVALARRSYEREPMRSGAGAWS